MMHGSAQFPNEVSLPPYILQPNFQQCAITEINSAASFKLLDEPSSGSVVAYESSKMAANRLPTTCLLPQEYIAPKEVNNIQN